MSQTSITIDGVETTFGYFSSPSVVYEYNSGTDTFDTLDPQPEFQISAGNLLINDTVYVRTSAEDVVRTVYEDPVIETTTTVSESNNAIVTDGSVRYINLTVPADKVATIQYRGGEMLTSDFPCLLKTGSAITFGLKDSVLSDTPYAYWIRTFSTDYDLHYQEVVFTTNVSDSNIFFQIGNGQVTGNKFYVYEDDDYKYIVKKSGYMPVSGSGTVTYSSKDGNVISINITMEEATARDLNVTDYNYTQSGDDVMLTEYIGESTEVKVPDVGE